MTLRFLLLLSFLLVAACASNRPLGGSPDLTLVDTRELPPPSTADAAGQPQPFAIGPYDKLSIDVFGVDALQRDVQVDGGGNINFPLVGAVQAAGKTPEELSQAIEQQLRGRFVRNPQVTVNLQDPVSHVVTIDGQVLKPGSYPALAGMTLMRAVAAAGGLGEYADDEDVVIIRSAKGRRYAGLYNLKGIRRGNYPDPVVYSGDMIIVGDSPGRRTFDKILKTVPLLNTPLIFALRG
jgi:polysaccharide export outer membrane protein